MSSRTPVRAYFGLAILVVGAFLLCLIFGAIYFTPAETFAAADKADIKLVVATSACLLLIFTGTLFYWVFHTPTVRRLIVSGWRAVFVYSGFAMGFSVFGWPRLESARRNEDGSVAVDFDLTALTAQVWPNLAVCFTALLLFSGLYFLLGWYESKIGQSIE